MSKTVLALCVSCALLWPVAAASAEQSTASKPAKQAVTSAVNGPLAISGLASSGRNCIGPSGSNVHAVGWVPASSRVVISFYSDFDPVAAVTITQLGTEVPNALARVSFWSDDDGGGNLDPELRFTTSYSGTLAIYVSKFSADRTAGCYFYKVEITTP